jgi:nucleoside-diphosphate-sugar epimerase
MTPPGGCVALTGGTGFLGPHIAEALRSAGWRVRYLSRSPRPGLPAGDTVLGNLHTAAALDDLLGGVDVVVHAAGAIKAVRDADFFHANRDGSRALAAAVHRQGRPLPVVVVSSLAAREPGLSAYAQSKRAGEDAFAEAGIAPTILRPTAVYGPGDKETAVFLRACAGPLMPVPQVPNGRVTLIHAADVARAVAAVVAAPQPGRSYELTDANRDGLSWPALAAAIRSACASRAAIVEVPRPVFRAVAACAGLAGRATGRAAMLTPGKVREMFHPDWSSALEHQPPADLWLPRIGLAEGLAETISWLRAKPKPPEQGRFTHAG